MNSAKGEFSPAYLEPTVPFFLLLATCGISGENFGQNFSQGMNMKQLQHEIRIVLFSCPCPKQTLKGYLLILFSSLILRIGVLSPHL